MRFFRHSVPVLLAALLCVPAAADAAVTPEQRQELAALSKEVGEIARMLRKKDQLDAAETALNDVEAKLDALVQGGVPENERLVSIIKSNIAARRKSLALQRGEKPAGVSFSKDIAPIIQANCLDCHGAQNPKGGLRLDTFAGWKAGGASKMSLGQTLLPRLTTQNPQQRMPKGKSALDLASIQTIARWVGEGAKFDGKADAAPIGEMAEEEEEKKPEEKLMIAKPKGTETVSFTKDVAPWFVSICGQCHMGNNPRGGFNITTFEGVMKGGDSGPVITPGKEEASRLWLMVSNKEQPRMPPGQLRINRMMYDALTTWIKEGAVFDGGDAKKPLRDLVPTAAQMQAKDLAKLTPEQFLEHRRERSEEQWKRAFPKEPSAPVETDDLLVYGNVGGDRLKTLAAWAQEQAAAVKSMFSAKDAPLWKGKLAVFVAKDRFGFEEFALAVDRKSEVPKEVRGYAVVTPDFDEARILVEDIGDDASASSPGMKAQLANLLTQAYLERGGAKLPDWAVQGTGLYAAAKTADGNPYFNGLRSQVAGSLKQVTKPEQILADGTFPPGESAAVGYALVDYLVQSGGLPKYAQFLTSLSGAGDTAAAAQAVYRSTPDALATGFLQSGAAARRSR